MYCDEIVQCVESAAGYGADFFFSITDDDIDRRHAHGRNKADVYHGSNYTNVRRSYV